jgi:hypothetical protein
MIFICNLQRMEPHHAPCAMTRDFRMTNQRTDLNCFIRTMVDHLYDSLKEAQSHPISRNVAVIEAQDGYRILTWKLARDDTPGEPKGIGFTIVLLLDDFFRIYPRIEDDATSEAFEQAVPSILDKLDIIKGLVPLTESNPALPSV